MNFKRMKITKIVANVIGSSHKDSLADTLLHKKFCVLTDESTDISSVKTSCIVVRFFDEGTMKMCSKFWELHPIFSKDDANRANEGATGKNIFEGIMESFKKYSIPTDNRVGFASDGCNVMMGSKNSVACRFREEMPGILIIKCICHSAHICASEACRNLPRRCEDLARNIYNFMKSSAKRQAQLVQSQEFVDVEPHKMLHPSQTRWLSLVAVVARILEQWDALTLFFTDMWLSERLVAAEQILHCLRDPFVKLCYLFLQWVLPKFTYLNAYFQSSKVVVTELQDKMCELYRDILLCFLDRQYVMKTDLSKIDPCDKEKHLANSMMYLGVGVMSYVDKPEVLAVPALRQDFYERCRSFLQVAALEIKKRWDFNDPVLSKIGILNPKRALSNTTREAYPSIIPLISVLPRVMPEKQVEKLQVLDDEWRRLPLVNIPVEISSEDQPDTFWGKLKKWKSPTGESEFAYLSQSALDALCLPHSNADCERVFSKVNLIKQKQETDSSQKP